MTISQNAVDVRARARQGVPGMVAVTSPLNRFATYINEDPQAVQSDTATISGTTFPKTLTINGIDVTVTTGANVTEIAANLVAAIDAEPAVRGQVSASSLAGVITLTGLTPGLAYTLTEDDAEIALASVSTAASAAPIPFGRLCLDDGPHPDGGPTRLGKLAQLSAFTAQVSTLTVTFAAGNYSIVVVDKATGRILADVVVPGNTDDNTTASDIEAALAAALPANTVDESVATNVVTLTAEVAGFEFEVTVSTTGAGAIALANTTPASEATSLARAAAGVSMHTIMDEAATIGAQVGQVPANHGFRALQTGPIWVDRPGTVTSSSPVFVELAAGDDAGKFYTTGSATRIELGSLSWDRDGRTASDNISVLRVALG